MDIHFDADDGQLLYQSSHIHPDISRESQGLDCIRATQVNLRSCIKISDQAACMRLPTCTEDAV